MATLSRLTFVSVELLSLTKGCDLIHNYLVSLQVFTNSPEAIESVRAFYCLQGKAYLTLC